MSHQPERKEKNCLNCGTALYGRFCHVCGQENIVTHQKFLGMITHFLSDLFHFDGKFFETLKQLFLRPGMISKEYCQGKRTKYLDPIRMYLFTSAIFFIFFWQLQKLEMRVNANFFVTPAERIELLKDLYEQYKEHPNDTTLPKLIALVKDTAFQIRLDTSKKQMADSNKVHFKGMDYAISYDSTTRLKDMISIHPTDGWIKRQFKKKAAIFTEKYGNDPSEGIARLGEIFLHNLPYLLFISLPFFAGILNLLYTRRKNYYFSDHAVFTLHHYILSFIIMLLIFILGAFQQRYRVGFLGYAMTVLGIIYLLYLFLAMKNFYGQGIMKTFLKFLLLIFLALIVLLILITIFLIFSVFQI
jgi:Xanthine/uracil permeases